MPKSNARYGAVLDGFPRVRLGHLPTPLHHVPRYGSRIGHDQLYVKRDDLTGLAMGGNKVRNLEFEMGSALQQDADIILVAGGLQSNYCRLATAAAAQLGIECVQVHNDHPPEQYHGNMLLSHILGARPVFLGPVDEEERGIWLEEYARELRLQGHRPYIVGTSPLSCLGYVHAAFELHEQARARAINLEHVGMVGAMGGTAAGFAFGAALLGAPFQVHVISVEYPAQHLQRVMTELWDGMAELLNIVPSSSLEDVIQLHEDYLGPGYAIPTPESLQAIYDMAQTEGILLECVYTSKAVWGTADLIARGLISATAPACIFHTGGLPALFAQGPLFSR